jgi:hypothetical protein
MGKREDEKTWWYINMDLRIYGYMLICKMDTWVDEFEAELHIFPFRISIFCR